MKKLKTLKTLLLAYAKKEQPMWLVCLVGGLLFFLLIRTIDTLIGLLFAWLNFDNFAIVAGVGSGAGFVLGYFVWNWLIGRSYRRQIRFLEKTLDTLIQTMAQGFAKAVENQAGTNSRSPRVEGDEWKDNG